MTKNEPVWPHDLECEKAVIGACILDKEAFLETQPIVTRDDFYQPSHQVIWDALVHLSASNKPLDLLSLKDQLGPFLNQVGGPSYLIELAQSIVTSALAPDHARIISKLAKRRRMMKASQSLYSDCERGEKDVDEISRDFVSSILATDKEEEKVRHIGDFSGEVIEWAQQLLAGDEADNPNEVHTGLEVVDQITSGFLRGEFVVCAARPSVGKTALACRIAEHIAQTQPVLFFSIEMRDFLLSQRIYFSAARQSIYDYRKGNVLADGIRGLIEAVQRVSQDLDLWVHGGDAGLNNLIACAERLKIQKGSLGLVVIDYAQLIEMETKKQGFSMGNRNEQLEYITRTIKRMAERLDCPVLALSQLSRKAVEKVSSDNPDPDELLGCLRGSGGFENDADIVFILWRNDESEEENYGYDMDNNPYVLRNLYVVKNRNGDLGNCRLRFYKKFMRFETL